MTKQLLIDCRTALNDWVTTYASEFCDPKTVDDAHTRIAEGGGTLAYIGKLTERLSIEIDRQPVEPEAESAPILARTFRLDQDGLYCGFCHAPIPVRSDPRKCCTKGHMEDERNK